MIGDLRIILARAEVGKEKHLNRRGSCRRPLSGGAAGGGRRGRARQSVDDDQRKMEGGREREDMVPRVPKTVLRFDDVLGGLTGPRKAATLTAKGHRLKSAKEEGT